MTPLESFLGFNINSKHDNICTRKATMAFVITIWLPKSFDGLGRSLNCLPGSCGKNWARFATFP